MPKIDIADNKNVTAILLYLSSGNSLGKNYANAIAEEVKISQPSISAILKYLCKEDILPKPVRKPKPNRQTYGVDYKLLTKKYLETIEFKSTSNLFMDAVFELYLKALWMQKYVLIRPDITPPNLSLNDLFKEITHILTAMSYDQAKNKTISVKQVVDEKTSSTKDNKELVEFIEHLIHKGVTELEDVRFDTINSIIKKFTKE